jgi:hypothetical protein
VPANTHANLGCLCFGDGFFVAGGSVGAFAASTDGINWKMLNAGQDHYAIFDIAYGRSTFVALSGGLRILQSDPIVLLSLRQVSPASGEGPGMELTISGPPEGTCQIQSTSQMPPSDGWQTVASVTLTNAPTVWLDPQPAGPSPRLYRAVLQP